MQTHFTITEMTEFFEYLDGLRGSGVTNMFGAGAYLASEFEMSKPHSSKVLSAWMQTFNRDTSASYRAHIALEDSK